MEIRRAPGGKEELHMATRVGINGFGRIGRMVFRHLMEDGRLQVVGLNDIAPLDNLAYLLKYDSVHPRPSADIRAEGGLLHWDKAEVEFTQVKNPAELPWKKRGVEIVIEASGHFTKREDAAKHLDAGAKCVIITAPGKGADLTVCMGVNEDRLDLAKHLVISNASCTTNCLAPVAKVLNDEFGIISGVLTTVHAYTASQALVDGPSKKWRRGRAAALSIIPTTTGAAVATTEVLPELKGKIDGLAMRVPVACGSVIDFTVHTERPATAESVNAAFRKAAGGDRMKGILGVSDEELVSSDVIGSELSSLVDSASTMVMGDRMVKVLAWYDNEWGYARRVADLAWFVSRMASERSAVAASGG
jgi:glyceraldehyde 3-phosphate dehydrogenase